MHFWTQWTPLLLAVFLMVPAAISDLRKRCIPNYLCLCGFIGGVVFHGWSTGWPGAGGALLAGILMLAAMSGLFAINVLGAGDVKLLAAASTIGGNMPTALNILLVTAVVGGVLAVLMLFIRRLGMKAGLLTGQGSSDDVVDCTPPTNSVPYGVAITIGTLIALGYGLT